MAVVYNRHCCRRARLLAVSLFTLQNLEGRAIYTAMTRVTHVALLLAISVVLFAHKAAAQCTREAIVSGLVGFVRNAVSSDSQSLAAVAVEGQNIVCLATGASRGTYRQASVVVNCAGTGSGTVNNVCPPESG